MKGWIYWEVEEIDNKFKLTIIEIEIEWIRTLRIKRIKYD